MNRSSRHIIFYFIGFVLLVGLACGTSAPADPTATPRPEVQVEVPAQPTVEEVVVEEVVIPTATNPPVRQLPPTESALPTEPAPPIVQATEPPVVEPQAYFIEEFEGDLSSWSYFLMSGDESKMDLYADYGRLIFDLQGRDQWVYFLYDEYIYSDVRIDVYAENLGKNTNNVSLICNYSDRFGWYEFNISNGGLYDIYIYSELDGGYISLASGGSKNVRIGRDVNVYTAICQGNKLSLYINNVFEREFVDTKYNLREGLVGLSVSSFDVLPILVEVDYFAISQP
jgi:hypothetical protein